MRTWLFLAGAALMAATAVPASAASRFSESLSDADRQACGIDRLSSDQVAALDALVHRVEADAPEPGPAAAKPFSQQLIPDEFRAAGLGLLTAPQRARLDAQVAADGSPAGHPALAALAGTGAAAPAGVEAQRPAPEIHGFVALTYGFGGGTSFREATTAVDYVDPSHRLELGVSFSQIEGKLPYACGPRLP